MFGRKLAWLIAQRNISETINKMGGCQNWPIQRKPVVFFMLLRPEEKMFPKLKW